MTKDICQNNKGDVYLSVLRQGDPQTSCLSPGPLCKPGRPTKYFNRLPKQVHHVGVLGTVFHTRESADWIVLTFMEWCHIFPIIPSKTTPAPERLANNVEVTSPRLAAGDVWGLLAFVFWCLVYNASEADSLELIDSNPCSVFLFVIKVNVYFVFLFVCFSSQKWLWLELESRKRQHLTLENFIIIFFF